ncbi:MAG TPA: hypothetical protein EYP35_09715 [Desulfobacterales bacterium]|nr:hypothetical protein [Desulfobacterales bacterium]
MKIDCPHCGVHGSVDDSYAGRKLRCPKCMKVFLFTEDILPPVDDSGMMRQEILYDDEPVSTEAAALGLLPSEADEVIEPEEEELGIDAEESEETSDTSLKTCSSCNQEFDEEFLEEVDSKLYCSICMPESAEESSEIPEEDVLSDDTLEDEDDALGNIDEIDEVENLEDEDAVAEDFDLLEEADQVVAEEESDLDSTDEDDAFQEVCSVCGDKFHPDFLQEIDSKLYCGICQPEVVETVLDGEVIAAGTGTAVAATAAAVATTDSEDDSEDVAVEQVDEEEVPETFTDFTVGELIKEAWQKTKGTKASIWGGVLFMYLVIFGISFAGVFALQGMVGQMAPNSAIGFNVGLQVVTSWLSSMFMAGLMLIGVRHAKEQRISWKMVFAGFSRALSITIALTLQLILVVIGFVLLVLPGIYLSVGYALALPLILEKGLGPWEALETSRKAIHKKWWTVFGLYLVMLLLYMVSIVPLGLGLIWTVPMLFVLVGVLYVRFFGSDKVVGEEIAAEEEVEDKDIEEESEDVGSAAEEEEFEVIAEESKE